LASDWRAAAAKVNQLDAPVICPSPFIEGRWPVWQPDYPLPGFLYAHLEMYPIRGKTYLFPFETSPQAEQFAADVSAQSKRFVIYGWNQNVRFWSDWFAARGWRARRLGPFGDVDVTVFEKGV